MSTKPGQLHVDEAAIWDEDAAACLRRDVDVLNTMLQIRMAGVASHGGMTGLNNLDFWRERDAADFGLLYEAYDRKAFGLFHQSLYISDSNWTHWKNYRNGEAQVGDTRWPADFFEAGETPIYLLVHPDTYYLHHIYEQSQ